MAKPRTSHKPETSRRRLHIIFQKQEAPELFDFLGALPIGTEAALVRAILIRWYETTQETVQLHSALSELVPFDRQTIGRILATLNMSQHQVADAAKGSDKASQRGHSNHGNTMAADQEQVSPSLPTVVLPIQTALPATERPKPETVSNRISQNSLDASTPRLAPENTASQDLLVDHEADSFFTKLGLGS